MVEKKKVADVSIVSCMFINHQPQLVVSIQTLDSLHWRKFSASLLQMNEKLTRSQDMWRQTLRDIEERYV